MRVGGIDPSLVHAWLSGRSLARGLPPPVSDHGGYRVDTCSDVEVARWVFPAMTPGLAHLARTLDTPRHFLKLCGTAAELQAALPPSWRIEAPNWFMMADDRAGDCPMPPGYRSDVERDGAALHVQVRSDKGDIAASGHGGETAEAFVYDRIITTPEHRRRGLGRAVMGVLRSARRRPATVELLVATGEGRALYTALGWRTISPYTTASIGP